MVIEKKNAKRPGQYTREAEILKAIIWREKVKGRARMKERILYWSKAADHLTDEQLAKKLGTSTANISRTRRAAGMKKPAPYKGFHPRINGHQWNWLQKNFDKYDDKYLAKRLGYTIGGMLAFRKRYDLLKGHKGKWTRTKHPRGMKGKTHTPEMRKEISRRALAMWANPNFRLNSEDYKQEVSDRMSKLAATKNAANAYSSAKRGYRKDLGKIFFRSRWEANYARYLNLLKERGEVFKWEFESDTFWFEKIKRGVRSYCPDFKVWDTEASEPRYIEIKGWMDSKSKTKLKRMAKYYPAIKISIVEEKEYKSIEKSLGRIIPNWEFKVRIESLEKASVA